MEVTAGFNSVSTSSWRMKIHRHLRKGKNSEHANNHDVKRQEIP